MKISREAEFCRERGLNEDLPVVGRLYRCHGGAELGKSLIGDPGSENKVEVPVVGAEGGLKKIVSFFPRCHHVVIQSKKGVLIQAGTLTKTHPHKNFISDVSVVVEVAKPNLTVAVFPIIFSGRAATRVRVLLGAVGITSNEGKVVGKCISNLSFKSTGAQIARDLGFTLLPEERGIPRVGHIDRRTGGNDQ